MSIRVLAVDDEADVLRLIQIKLSKAGFEVLTARDGEEGVTTAMADVLSPPRKSTNGYWEAQGVAELALAQFDAGLADDDRAAERQAFYRLAHYYQRTRTIAREALTRRREPLAQAALRNLVALHR